MFLVPNKISQIVIEGIFQRSFRIYYSSIIAAPEEFCPLIFHLERVELVIKLVVRNGRQVFHHL